MRDICDRKIIEEALRQSEKCFRLAFEDAAIGMARVSLDGNFIEVNRTLCDITGYSEIELLRSNFQHITHPEDHDYDWEKANQLCSLSSAILPKLMPPTPARKANRAGPGHQQHPRIGQHVLRYASSLNT